jgi:hypothetical protein
MYFVLCPAIVKVRGVRVLFTTRKTIPPGSSSTGAARQISGVIVTRTCVWRCADPPDETNPARRRTPAARIAKTLTGTRFTAGVG